MLDVKEVVGKASLFVSNVFGEEEVRNISLEEVKISEDEQFWFITLGLYVPNKNPARKHLGMTLASISEPYLKQYKIFKIESETGKVVSMKIREV